MGEKSQEKKEERTQRDKLEEDFFSFQVTFKIFKLNFQNSEVKIQCI